MGSRAGVDAVVGGGVGFEVLGVNDLRPVVGVDQGWGVHDGVGEELIDLVWVEFGPAFDGGFGE